MRTRMPWPLLAWGLFAFLFAALSIVDMFRPRPYDGIVLEADAPGRLVVRQVLPGSGAHRAGIRPGEQVLGIDRNILHSVTHGARLLHQRQIGDTVAYFVGGADGPREVMVKLGPRQMGNLPYFWACTLGFAFFFIGVFVLHRQPRLRAAQLFFVLGTVFLLFLVCRLRPASYTWVDHLVLTVGTLALLVLPAAFLHFFLVFPRPVPLRPEPGDDARRWRMLVAYIYLVPPLVLAGTLWMATSEGRPLRLISGAPMENWWVLAIYMLTGLGALAYNALRLKSRRERSGAALIFFGSLFGLLPFLVTAIAFPSLLHTEKLLPYGLAPLALVPLTFAYAIVRFQLLDVRVIVRKSLFYTATTAVVTALYAGAIALFNVFSSDTELAASPLFPLLFALAIVVLFEPLRRRVQALVDRFYLAERTQLEQAIREVGDAVTARSDLEEVVRSLVAKLPALLGVRFAALYLLRDGRLERAAGPTTLPKVVPPLAGLGEELTRRRGLTRLGDLDRLARENPEVGELAGQLEAAGVELVGELATPRRVIGGVLLSSKTGQLAWDPAELDLLRRLLQQAAIALETQQLLEERARQAELERELEIAASVQAQLLPHRVSFAPGWRVAAHCRPARHVGGDFFTELPGRHDACRGLVYGDVAGKSVAGALVMMAAHEVLHSLAISQRDPEELINLANRRLYGLATRRSFVALAYLTSSLDGRGIDYLLAGQPQPLVRRHDGSVSELDLPRNRVPLGALDNGRYHLLHVPLGPGDLLLGYSDGVLEARDPRGELFGADRLMRVVAQSGPEPEEVVSRVLAALERFSRGTEPYDDVTLVALARDREVER